MTQTYRIRVSDRLGPALRIAFAGMRAEVVPRQTVIEGWLTIDEFHALLLRVDQVGVRLIRVECAVDGNAVAGGIADARASAGPAGSGVVPDEIIPPG